MSLPNREKKKKSRRRSDLGAAVETITERRTTESISYDVQTEDIPCVVFAVHTFTLVQPEENQGGVASMILMGTKVCINTASVKQGTAVGIQKKTRYIMHHAPTGLSLIHI